MKKMNFALAMLVASVLVSACGDERNALNSDGTQTGIYGTWKGIPAVTFGEAAEGGKVIGRLRIEPNQTTVLSACTFNDGMTIEASATSPSKTTVDTLEVLEARDNVEVRGDRRCRASLDKGKAKYSLSGDKLTLTMEKGETLTLSRE